jgi:glycosyltransferase involved in cell wall biosynthesis
MTGGGDDKIEGQLRDMCKACGIEDKVTFTGFMKPEEVRDRMERADIFLFTSNHLEGWGAVLNEAMNSGCAVVACSAAGAVPYLVRDGENGFTYREKDVSSLKRSVLMLAKDAGLREKLGNNAYETVASEWNAGTAAENLMRFIEKREFAEKGPCSRA